MRLQRGFSLVELMVALVIGLIIVAAVIQLFVNTRQMYQTQNGYAQLQENGRYALTMLSDAIESTGYSGCHSRNEASVKNTLNSFTQLQRNYEILISGNAYLGTSWMPALDSEIQQRAPQSNSDVITIRNIQSADVRVTSYNNADGKISMKVSNTNNLKQDDYILVHNCEVSAIFQLANPPSVNTLVTTATISNLDYKFNTGSRVNQIDTNTFFVRQNPNNLPALYRFSSSGLEELIEGVESIKLTFGINETGGNGSVDKYLTADKVDALNAWNDVLSVRLSLLMVSSESNLTTQDYQFSDEGDFKEYVPVNGDRLRRVITKTITLRNRVP